MSRNIRAESCVPAVKFRVLKGIQRCIEADNPETRARLKTLFKNSLFVPRYNITLSQERELAYKRIKRIFDEKVVSVFDFERNPLNIFTTHEVCGMVDGSMATKLTVQLNLFGGTIVKLGTERHRKFLNGVDNLSTVGCFALTELGYGNNAVEMETTAHYLPQSHEFEINSPSTLSQKYWITNGAIHATFAIVFAQLHVNGTNEGVHAILARIRNDDMSICKGVTIRDMGYKFGCNGVDNATLLFSKVRVPADNLLNKYSNVVKGAVQPFTSKLPRGRVRFLSVADQLIAGRLCIASMSIGGTRAVLLTAFRYAATRLAVGKSGKSDAPLLSFGLQQNALIPLLAQTIVYGFGLSHSRRMWAHLSTMASPENISKAASTTVVVHACVIKPLITWHFERTASICRERCGGQGYLSCNVFGSAVGFSHAGISAEGDNAVLMVKVAKELLELHAKGAYPTDISAHMPNSNSSGSRDFSAAGSGVSLFLRKHSSVTETALGYLRTLEARLALRLVKGMKNLAAKSSSKEEFKNMQYEMWSKNEVRIIQGFARAFGQRMSLDACVKELIQMEAAGNGCADSLEAVNRLIPVAELFGVLSVLENSEHMLSEHVLTPEDILSCTRWRDEAITKIGAFALDLVHSLGVDLDLIHSPAAGDWISFNQRDNNGEVADFSSSKL